jgi:hypothetical protein
LSTLLINDVLVLLALELDVKGRIEADRAFRVLHPPLFLFGYLVYLSIQDVIWASIFRNVVGSLNFAPDLIDVALIMANTGLDIVDVKAVSFV